MTISAAEISKIQNDIKKIILNKVKLNQLKISDITSGLSDLSNADIEKIKARNSNEVTDADINSIFDDFKIDFSDNFNWEKYANSINKEHDGKNSSIFDRIADNSSDDELSLMQIFNAVLSNDDVFKQIDAGTEDENGKVSGKGDGQISAEELQAYFEELAAADEDAGSISLDDFGNFFAKKNEEADKEDKIDFADAAKKAEEEYNTKKKESEKTDKTGGSDGTGGIGGGGTTPVSPAAPKNDSQETPADDKEQAPEPFPKKVDPSTLPTSDKEKYISYSISNLKDLTDLDSSKLTGDVKSGENPISGMANISEEDRQKLQQAASAKETAKTDMETAKEAAEKNKSEAFEYIENYKTATETLTTAEEEVNDSTALVETYTSEQQTLEQTIQGMDESISALEGQIQQVPDLPADATEEQKNQRLEIINSNKAIENQIKQLKEQKTQAEEQKAQIDSSLEEATANLEAAKTAFEEATQALEEAKLALEEVKDKQTDEEKNYLKSIETFNKAGSEYNTVKNEIMQKIQQEVKEQGETVVNNRKEEDTKVEAPSLKDDPLALKSAKILDEIERMKSGALKPENASSEARELMEKYNKLDDKQKALIKAAYGDEYSFLATMSVLGSEDFSDKEKYNDVFFNSQYLTTLYTELEKIGLTPDSQDFSEKVAAVLKKIDTSKLTSSEPIFQYFTMAGIANGGNLAVTILSKEDKYAGEENYKKLINLVTMLRNFSWEE